MAPSAHRRVRGDGLPAVVPDTAGAEHRVELCRARTGNGRGVEAVAHADALDRCLGHPFDRLGRLDAQTVQDRWDDVDRVVVLVPHLATRGGAGRPGDDAGVARSAVEEVAL